ncbi:MAG: class I SAM-dependent methyltransferase [Planctomycetaceae bacterium]|jgi:16S rRNA G966 N2-methylase RsmD|nr:class I SAM-dependent methyltransferase [Planctomycetaceae bacterium]
MNKILYFFSQLPSRIYWKIKNTILRWRGCDFADFRDPSFGFEIGYTYRPSSVIEFRRIMRKVDREFLPFEQMSFFDAGFGKGATLIEAMKIGIPVVGGVELSETMFEICQKNLKILGRERESTKLYRGNAATMTEQLDDFNLFYFANPFPESVMKQYIQNIIDSAKRKPRKLIMVYYHATLHHVLEAAGLRLLYSYQVKVLFRPEAISLNKIYCLPDEMNNSTVKN